MVSVYGNILRQTAYQVTTTHFHGGRVIYTHSSTDFNLNAFSSTLTNEQIKHFANITYDSSINCVTASTNTFTYNNATQGNNCYFTGATTNIYNHAASSFLYRKPCTDCCSHRFFNQICFTRASFDGSIDNCTFFNFGYARRHTYQNTGTYERTATHCFFNKVLQHGLSNFVISNNTIFHRTDSNDITRSTTNHTLCFGTDSKHFVSINFYCHNGRLTNDDAFFLAMHQGISSTQIYTHIIRHIVEKTNVRKLKFHFVFLHNYNASFSRKL